MNNKRRLSLRNALDMLSRAFNIIETVCNEEEDAVENYPANLQSTDTYLAMEDAVEQLNDAMENIEEAKGNIESVIGN